MEARRARRHRRGAIVIEGNRIRRSVPRIGDHPRRRKADRRRRQDDHPRPHRRARPHPRRGHLIPAEQNWPPVATSPSASHVARSVDRHRDVFPGRDRARAPVGPRPYSTGTILYGAEPPFKAVIDTYEDALAHIRRLKASGVQCQELQPAAARPRQRSSAAREPEYAGRARGGSLFFQNMTHDPDGHTGIEHNLPVTAL